MTIATQAIAHIALNLLVLAIRNVWFTDITNCWFLLLMLFSTLLLRFPFVVVCFGSFFPISLLFSGLGCGDWTSHFFPLVKSFVELALSCCMVKLPISFDAFLSKLAESVVLYTSEFVLLLWLWDLYIISGGWLTLFQKQPRSPKRDTTSTVLHRWPFTLWFNKQVLYFFFPSLWLMLVLISSVHKILFQNFCGIISS